MVPLILSAKERAVRGTHLGPCCTPSYTSLHRGPANKLYGGSLPFSVGAMEELGPSFTSSYISLHGGPATKLYGCSLLFSVGGKRVELYQTVPGHGTLMMVSVNISQKPIFLILWDIRALLQLMSVLC